MILPLSDGVSVVVQFDYYTTTVILSVAVFQA
jgi:hypothetical protein